MSVRLADEPFAAERELAEFTAGLAGEGAVVSFLGIARARAADGEKVERLVLDHHPRLTLGSLDEIAAAARERFGLSSLRIVHRCGAVAPGETIVFVAAAAAHRRAAFEAADYMMDRLKTDAVFWKREDGPGGLALDRAAGGRLSRPRKVERDAVPGIDESRTFHPLRIAVLTVSDTRTDETDTSGAPARRAARRPPATSSPARRSSATRSKPSAPRSGPGSPTRRWTSSSPPAAPASRRATSRRRR